MKEFRITKYDPDNRDISGAYLDDEEWICFSEVGTNVSKEEYEQVESNYIESAMDLVSATFLTVNDLVGIDRASDLHEGKKIEGDEVRRTIKSILRNEYWARLESETSFIHIGWDYYMYVGVSKAPYSSVIERIQNRNLFIESWTSPYHREECEQVGAGDAEEAV